MGPELERCMNLCFLFLLWGCPKKVENSVEQNILSVEKKTIVHKSSIDRRLYRFQTLENGMKMLLISDHLADMSAAALSVRVGQFHDPVEREGLAHFLEHMLFLGTEKYPEEGAYRKFITENGGRSNAGTGQERTSYFFSVQKEAFQEALDRFGYFFISPTLDADFVQRERNAVNSEYQLKRKEDARRYREVRRKTSNPAHPFSKFSVGNLDTLSDEHGLVWEDLRKFYDAQYSADRMNVVLISAHSLDEMEGWATDLFTQVPKREKINQEIVPVLLPTQLQKIVSLKSLKNKRKIVLQFPAPSLEEHFDQQIDSLLFRLLGHEGEGSLAAVLKEQGWLENLNAGNSGSDDHVLYDISMELTSEGYANWEEVVGMVMAYVRLIQNTDLQRYYQENRRLEDLRFSFAESQDPAGSAYSAASALHYVPAEHVLDYKRVFAPLKKELLSEHLNALSLTNMRIMKMAPDIEGDQVEPLYDTSYRVDSFLPEQQQKWGEAVDERLSLPKMNPYLPTDVSLKDIPEENIPSLIWEDEGVVLWHHSDMEFSIPKVQSHVDLLFSETPKQRLIRELWVSLIQKSIEKNAYPQSLAGSSMSVRNLNAGIRLRVEAYHERHRAMNKELMTAVFEGIRSEELFIRIKNEKMEDIQNRSKERPYNQALRALRKALVVHSSTAVESLEIYDTLRYEEFLIAIGEMKSQGFVRILTYGNLTPEDAKSFGMEVLVDMDLKAHTDRPEPHLFVPEKDISWNLTVDHHDSVFVRHLQGTNPSMREQARYLFFAHLIRAPFFTELRTKQQLGYIVSAAYSRRHGLPAVRFGIQSSNTHPDELEKRVEAFLSDKQEWVKNMSDSEFEESRQGLIAKLTAKDGSFSERAQRWAENLDVGMMKFDRKAKLVAQLKGLNQREMEIFVRQSMYDAPAMILKSVGQAHSERPLKQNCIDLECVRSDMRIQKAQ
jgi:insulysin